MLQCNTRASGYTVGYPCRDHCPPVSATFNTTAFDGSRSRCLGISDLIAELWRDGLARQSGWDWRDNLDGTRRPREVIIYGGRLVGKDFD
jgi:hypothetical protein